MAENYSFKNEYRIINITKASLTQLIKDVLNDLNQGVRLASNTDSFCLLSLQNSLPLSV